MNFNFDSLMDTISNLRERGAEYANVAMDKTKDAARLAKLTVSLTGEKDALKKAYIELGKAYYEEHHNDAEGLYAQLVEEVDAVNARLLPLDGYESKFTPDDAELIRRSKLGV